MRRLQIQAEEKWKRFDKCVSAAQSIDKQDGFGLLFFFYMCNFDWINEAINEQVRIQYHHQQQQKIKLYTSEVIVAERVYAP